MELLADSHILKVWFASWPLTSWMSVLYKRSAAERVLVWDYRFRRAPKDGKPETNSGGNLLDLTEAKAIVRCDALADRIAMSYNAGVRDSILINGDVDKLNAALAKKPWNWG